MAEGERDGEREGFVVGLLWFGFAVTWDRNGVVILREEERVGRERRWENGNGFEDDDDDEVVVGDGALNGGLKFMACP